MGKGEGGGGVFRLRHFVNLAFMIAGLSISLSIMKSGVVSLEAKLLGALLFFVSFPRAWGFVDWVSKLREHVGDLGEGVVYGLLGGLLLLSEVLVFVSFGFTYYGFFNALPFALVFFGLLFCVVIGLEVNLFFKERSEVIG